MDALKYAIENTDLPALIAELYPDSGAQPSKEGRCVAVWRGGERDSVSLYKASNGTFMYKDFATDQGGNSFNWLVNEHGLSPSETAKELKQRCNVDGSSTSCNKKGLGEIVATYDYKDVNGDLVHQTVRYEPKEFRQRRPAPDGGWIWGLKAGTYYKNSMGDWSKNGKGEAREFPVCETIPYNLKTLLGSRDRNEIAVIAEGEKDAETFARFGFIATCNCGGGGNWTKGELAKFKGLDVIVVGDSDEPDPRTKKRKGVVVAKKLANALIDIANSVLGPVFMPNGFKDVSDYVDSGATAEDLQALIYAAEPWEFDSDVNEEKVLEGIILEEDKSKKPVIQVNNRHLHEISDDAIKALHLSNNPPRLYIRSKLLSRVDEEGKAEIMDNAALKGYLDRCIKFITVRVHKEQQIVSPARPPSDLAPDLLSLQTSELGLPVLETVSTVPVITSQGKILTDDGYDAESKTLLILKNLDNFKFELISIAEIRRILDDLFVDFPFAFPEIGKAHAYAMLLQPFVRQMISGATPLYLIESPTRGTGKGLLCNIVSYVVTGKPAPIMTLPRTGEEMEKRITSNLLEGNPLILLDNVNKLGGDELAAILTAEIWRGRRLGKSEMLHISNHAMWVATGNNVDLCDDIPRRVIPIRLDAGVEKPEERKSFKHPDLKVFVLQNRSKIINACLSLVQHWVDSGYSKGSKNLGSYESYAQIIGGILEIANVTGFLEGREYLYEHSDKETTEWKSVCEAWYRDHGLLPLSAKDLLEICQNNNLLLDIWGARSQQAALQRLGHKLGKHRDRVFGKFIVRFAGKNNHMKSNEYKLEEIP